MHDDVKDSSITLVDLRNEGGFEDVLTTLDCLTKATDESYDTFIDRIVKNETACRVKLADLYDNMDISRIKNLTEKVILRIQKYKVADNRILNGLDLYIENS